MHPVFGPIINRITGYVTTVYRHGVGQFEVEVLDASGEYVGGATSESQSEAVRYALAHI